MGSLPLAPSGKPYCIFSSAQLLSRVRLFVTPWTVACQASLFITNSRSLLKLMSIELVMPSNHLIPCYPLLLLPSIFPNIRIFSNKSALCIRWSNYWSFSFSMSSSNEYWRFSLQRLISLQSKRFPRVFSSTTIWKVSILWCSAFFMVQRSHLYMTTAKTMALITEWYRCFLIQSLGLS